MRDRMGSSAERAWWALLVAVSAHVLPCTAFAQGGIEEIRFAISDSLMLHADVRRSSAPADAPLIILFHQGGGDARGEYSEIAPRLIAEGYHVIAVDARGGGNRFGGRNRALTPEGFRYCDALAEVGAAVNLAREQDFTGPIALWGSSYSAALVLQVAARRPAEVSAVLAFSPASGEPMAGCEAQPFLPMLVRAGVATLVLRPRAELEAPARAAQFDSIRATGVQTYIADNGVHGSSMLTPSRVQGDTEPHWRVVLSFLEEALRR